MSRITKDNDISELQAEDNVINDAVTNAVNSCIEEGIMKGYLEEHAERELLNAVLYVVDSGCKWRQLPHDFPKWQTVYSFFRRSIEKNLWDEILEHLVKVTRKKAGRNPNLSYALIDSQSVKTACASDQRGFDGEKNERTKTAYSY